MRIKTITMENIRSHAKSSIDFKRGFNCLVGGLGVGKSSILYAIDFALFGDPLTRSYHYLLREGENSAKVAIEFLLNGKTYRIQRGLKRQGKGISQDMENLSFYEEDKLIANMKNEAVEEQLKAITGFDKEIFREVVWVRQEHLKELLDIAPRERQKRLDQLFGLSDYEVAWNNIRGLQKEFDGERKAYETDFDVLGMEKLEADYHTAVQEFMILENETSNLKKKLQEAEQTLHVASAKLKNLEQMRRQTEELLKTESELKTKLANTQDMSARLVDQIQSKIIIINEFEQHLSNLETQLESQRCHLKEVGLPPQLTIQELKQQLTAFDDQMTNIKAEQESARKETATSKQRVFNLTTESKCPLCFQPLSAEYKSHILQHIEAQNTEREARLKELQKSLSELEKLRNTANEAASSFQLQTPRIENAQVRVTEERQTKEKLEKEFEEYQTQEKTLQAQLEGVRTNISKFNRAELENAWKFNERALEQYHATKAKLESNESRQRDASSRIEDYRERLERTQQKVERVKQIQKLLEILDSIRDAYRSIQPKLRTEFIQVLERLVQQVLDRLVGDEGPALFARINETYTPSIKSQEGHEREVAFLSGGERTLLAFAYRFALGQLIMQARTGHGLQILLLDEPTESLGREDRSVDRLAEAIARLKAIEQIIAVTHNEAFAEKAEHVIWLEKEAATSKILVER